MKIALSYSLKVLYNKLVFTRFKQSTFVGYFMRHKWVYLGIILVVLVVGFLLRPKPPVSVPTQKVTRGQITQSVSGSGTVNSDTLVNLSFQLGGKLVYLGVKQGDSVIQGQTIAVLDQQTMQKNLENALRDYSIQRNKFDQTLADNGNRTASTALNDDMKRILEENQYDLDKAIISVQLQDLAKQQSILTSPINGIIIHEDVETAGINILPSTIFTVADPDHVLFKMDVDEADIANVRVGQPMHITLDAYPEKTITLSVDKIDFASHSTSTGGTAYTVQADFPDNLNYRYRIGMNGNAEITTNQKNNVLTIPLASLVQNHFVYVKAGTGFIKKSITTGVSSDTEIEVIAGLNLGDEVALQPTEAAKQVVKK